MLYPLAKQNEKLQFWCGHYSIRIANGCKWDVNAYINVFKIYNIFCNYISNYISIIAVFFPLSLSTYAHSFWAYHSCLVFLSALIDPLKPLSCFWLFWICFCKTCQTQHWTCLVISMWHSLGCHVCPELAKLLPAVFCSCIQTH